MTDPHRHTVAAVAACLIAGLLLAGCSSSTPAAHTTSAVQTTAASTDATSVAATAAASTAATTAAAATAGVTACALVTEQDITSTIGADPGKGTAVSSHRATQCQYGSFPKEVVIVNLVPSLGKLSYDHMLKDSKLHAVEIAGVGDRALEHSDPHTDAIYFTKGDALFYVGISAPTSPTKGGALALAKIAASRL